MSRRLSDDEADYWARATRDIVPLNPRARPARTRKQAMATAAEQAPAAPAPKKRQKDRIPAPPVAPPPPRTVQKSAAHLDGSWEKRISRGTLDADFSLDLHGSNLDQAWRRLMDGLGQAKAMGARVVLVVTGKARPVDAADRGTSRGAIRAKLPDWIAASEHAHDVVAIRGAHRRHGGHGALYVILKKRR